MNTAPLNDIGHVIQLAIAPVFLLMAISTLIGVLTNRLARAVDSSGRYDRPCPGARRLRTCSCASARIIDALTAASASSEIFS
jgi:hypothetical protein